MEDFSYCNPTQVEFGKDKEKNIGEYIISKDVKKVLICYGSERIKKDGLFYTVIESLKEKGIEYIDFGGIISNPTLSKVKEGIKLAKGNSIDGVLAVGGGSVLDSAKAIAVGTLYDGDIWDFFIKKEVITKALPVFDIMTLAATGSEMNCFAVITNEDTKEKYSIFSSHVYPKVSVINPLLMQSISNEYLVYSAADIIAHSIEGYFTASSQPTFLNRQIESIIKTVIDTTEILINNPKDYETRGEFAWAATNALNGTTFLGASGYTFPNHMIEHTLSALHNVPHGAGLSVVIPAWMKWYYKRNENQFTRFAKEIFGLPTAIEGIEALENWFNKIGTPTKLSQLNIEESDLAKIIENTNKRAEHFGLGDIYTKEALNKIMSNAL
ncbi:iron-containing alcohol dehydrogenase [Arcobacter nitrofigilis DSM 7299]|uniref:Iron-containing alcohol dehydrogenase n=1 Tax=Arcobacter nitrofigilis (strain ATCC 33309 / DSM 7299 / CCUG 15893 / LMG 7604 / NCTC 12251 / CI) TaxID=572480 RepID=D5V1Q0_ARCNC|nr:iron-containing alcohol dehydrogenase [Arcobacter nitrofigilis]ADG93484.1 iron-containing alcohol dehydrogenase [Arcobacter nitrofigilis DSM 7299]